jgi:hypothetical protein
MTVTHGQAEGLLLALHPGAAELVLGVAVARDRSGFCFTVADGPEALLLPSLDRLLAVAGFHPAPGPAAAPQGHQPAADTPQPPDAA